MLALRKILSIALFTLVSATARATDYAVELDGISPPPVLHGVLSTMIQTGDPVFQRPKYSGDFIGMHPCAESVFVGDFRYETITLTNTAATDTPFNFRVATATCEGEQDSVVFGYATFNANDPLSECLLVNDDGGDQGLCSLFSSTLAPSESMVIVITSYFPDKTWPWTGTFEESSLFEDGFE